MFLESPALTAPRAEWDAWRISLLEMNRRDATVKFALRRAEAVLAESHEHAIAAPAQEQVAYLS